MGFGVFISGGDDLRGLCAVLVISEVLTFLRGCGRLRAKIAIRVKVSKGIIRGFILNNDPK